MSLYICDDAILFTLLYRFSGLKYYNLDVNFFGALSFTKHLYQLSTHTDILS